MNRTHLLLLALMSAMVSGCSEKLFNAEGECVYIEGGGTAHPAATKRSSGK